MTQPIAKFHEEVSAKLPALTLLTNLGYQFLSPAQAFAMRESLSSVVLVDVLREVLQQKFIDFQGKRYPLSDAAIYNIIHQLSHPVMNEGLRIANEKLYDTLTYGINITEFIEGKKVHATIQLIDWEVPSNNRFHFTEECEVLNTHGIGKRIPDIVCFVNGLPWVVIEAKRPDASHTGKPTVEEGISQNIRNQKVDEIPHLFAYTQLLLAVNGHEGLYGTCGTPAKFWAKWKEEHISEADFSALKNQRLTPAHLETIFAHRTTKQKQAYLSLLAGGELLVTDQDRLIIALLTPERLLEMTRLFTLFDQKSGKIVARYQQVFGIKALVERISTFDEKGARNGG